MSDKLGWSSTLQWALWAGVMSLVMGWLARTRSQPRPSREVNSLAHPPSTLAIGLVCTCFFAAIAVLSALYPGKNGSPLVSLIFVGFAALGIPVLLDYRNARHTLTPDGLQYGRMLGGGGHLAWADVRTLRYSHSAKWFRLELRDGSVVRISAMLRGLPEFAAAALARVPAGAIDAETRQLLQATAAGDLPRIWS